MKNNGSKFSMHLGDIRAVELIRSDKDSFFLVIHEMIDDKMNSFSIDCSDIGHVQLFDDKIDLKDFSRGTNPPHIDRMEFEEMNSY